MAFGCSSPSLLRRYPTYTFICRHSSRSCGTPTWTTLLVLPAQHVPNQTDEMRLKTCFPVSITAPFSQHPYLKTRCLLQLLSAFTFGLLTSWVNSTTTVSSESISFAQPLPGNDLTQITATAPLTGLPTSHIDLAPSPPSHCCPVILPTHT